jgi:SAM-dependent methyltransferase
MEKAISESCPLAPSQYYAGHDLEALADLPHYCQWIMKSLAPYLRGDVLEVGAGIGNFASCYVTRVRKATLLEPAHNLFPTLAARFAHLSHVTSTCGRLEDWCETQKTSTDPDARSFDAIVLVNVLEHVSDDQRMLRQLRELLRPGGVLMLFVPAIRWLYGSLDSSVCHHRRYSYSGLTRIIARTGLELLCTRYFDALGVIPWFVTGRILRQRRFSRRAAIIYDRLIVPVASWIEQRLKPPLGKNLICLARRPAADNSATGVLDYGPARAA